MQEHERRKLKRQAIIDKQMSETNKTLKTAANPFSKSKKNMVDLEGDDAERGGK